MKYLILLVLLLLPFTAEAKPPHVYKEWLVTITFTTTKVIGVITSCIHKRSVMEATMEARKLAYYTITVPHTVHKISLVSGCEEEEKDEGN